AHRSSCVLFAALDAGFFAAMARGGATPAEIGAATGIAPLAAGLLLNALAALCLIERRGDGYRLRGDLRVLLTDREHDVARDLFRYPRETRVWLRAPAIFRGAAGAPAAYRRELLDSQLAAYAGIQAMNRILGQEIVERIDSIIAGARRALDVGGGDGGF